jgi:hypothetical protein
MKNAIFVLSALMIGILLFGCATQQVSHNGEENVNVQSNITTQQNTTVKPGGLEFSVPSELPVAYVGKPFVYSFNPTGGRTPYEITYKLRETAYDGSVGSALLSDFSRFPQPYGASKEQLNFTPQTGDEGQYLLEFCVKEGGDYRNKPVCKNTTLYIMSDDVKVKGSGKVTSSVVWDPRASVTVHGRGGDVEKTLPSHTAWVPVSQISSAGLSASTPAKLGQTLGWSGGAVVDFNMVANPTGVSQSATGGAACGTPNQDGSVNALNVDSFEVGWTTAIGLNITNDGTTEQVVDILVTGRSGVASDSKYYHAAGTTVTAQLGDTLFNLNQFSFGENALKPGEEVTDSKVVRVVVTPGSHVMQVGSITPELDGGSLGTTRCPVQVGISSGMTITVTGADLSDGKKPAWRISSSWISKIK